MLSENCWSKTLRDGQKMVEWWSETLQSVKRMVGFGTKNGKKLDDFKSISTCKRRKTGRRFSDQFLMSGRLTFASWDAKKRLFFQI